MTTDTDPQAELEAVFDWLRELLDRRPDLLGEVVKLLRLIGNMIAAR